MNSDNLPRCRGYIDSLANQIDYLLPPRQTDGRRSEPIPIERLPTIAALVREYIECEAILAGSEHPDNQQEDES